MAATLYSVSTEYLHAPITASVTLDQQTIEVAFVTGTAPDDQTSWVTAEWEGDAGTTRTWRVLVGPGTTSPLPAGSYTVFSRLTDSPEEVVRKHDTLTIK